MHFELRKATVGTRFLLSLRPAGYVTLLSCPTQDFFQLSQEEMALRQSRVREGRPRPWSPGAQLCL